MATQTKTRNTSTTEETADRVRELNERIIESSRKMGETYLDAYERSLINVADFQDRLGAQVPADLTRQFAEAWVSAGRAILDTTTTR